MSIVPEKCGHKDFFQPMKTMLPTTQILMIRCQQKCSCLSPRDSTKNILFIGLFHQKQFLSNRKSFTSTSSSNEKTFHPPLLLFTLPFSTHKAVALVHCCRDAHCCPTPMGCSLPPMFLPPLFNCGHKIIGVCPAPPPVRVLLTAIA